MSKNNVLQNGSVEKVGNDQDNEAADETQKMLDYHDQNNEAAAETQKMLDYPERKGSESGIKKTPQLNANLFSKYVSFWWLNSLVSLGAKRPLEASDLYDLMQQDTTEVVAEKLQREWDKEVKKSTKNGKQPNLICALLRAFGGHYALVGLLTLFADSLRLAQPLLIGQLVSYFAEESTMSTTDAFLYAVGVSLTAILINLLNTPFTFLCQVFGMRVRAACTALVFNKAVKLSNAGLASVTTGHVINLVSVDAQKFDYTSMWIHYLLLGPVETVVVTYLLWLQIGPACFAGMGVVILLAPFQVQMGNVLMMLRFKALEMVDERMKIMNEVISGMKVIKMYTWESSFAKWITKIRDKELKWFLRLQLVMGSFMAFFFSASAIISFVTFLTYVLTGNVLVAQKVFTCVALFANIKMVMAFKFPLAISLLNDCKVSWKRMEELMLQEEAHSEGLVTSKLRPRLENCEIIGDHVTAMWNKEMTAPTLDDLSFKVKPGELLGVIGAVGAGKSSLLMAILGELPLSKGAITVKGKIGYASQQAWIFNGSLRQNILFGQEYEKKRYEEVLSACALEKDIELLPDGDMTLVGERGVSLSGGQRARVNLARTVYLDADIYLMDDPLSAVDAHVGRHLFDKCISEYLADKPRILVTHQLQFLKEADQLLVLSGGKCVGLDTFKELSKKNIDFISQLIQEEEKAEAQTVLEIEANADHSEANLNPRPYFRQESRRPKSATFSRSSLRLFDSSLSITSAATIEMATAEEDILPEESKQSGMVTANTWRQYLKTWHSYPVAFSVLFVFVLSQVLVVLADWWLSFWSNAEEQHHYSKLSANVTISNTTSSVPDIDRNLYLTIYGGLVIALLVVAILGCEAFFSLMMVSSRRLHLGMLNGIISAPQYFFDTNSVGRILNRFSKDLTLIDDLLPVIMCDFIQMGLFCIGILCLVAVSNPITLIIVIPVVILFVGFRNYFMRTCREVKRIEGVSRSPLFGHFSTTLLGLDTIRAFGVEEAFSEQLNAYQDAHSRCWYTFLAARSSLNFRLESLCDVFIIFVSLVAPALKGTVELSAGSVGLMLSYSVMLTQVFQPFIEESAEVENLMTSVERILEYCDLESEAAPETDVKFPPDWPQKGNIVFRDMSLAYHKTLPNVLHKITCNIEPKEKVGVVGRTGAGKSSLLTTLFRMAEPSGLIEIDGIKISDLGLRDLRSKLSIIPQEPVIFTGSMRRNLDPFNEYTDADLWQVLEEVQLKQAVSDLPSKLEEELAEAGSNFSVGQRQLVCLARAILKHSRILVIDEATANVDPKTDALIQTTIRERFKDCTVMTIAHRLHTIMDSDRVMVLDAGRLKEFDAPYTLLKNSSSIFHQLVEQTGLEEAKRLLEIARKSYEDKREPISEIKEEEGEEEEDVSGRMAATETAVVDTTQAHIKETPDDGEVDACQIGFDRRESNGKIDKHPPAFSKESSDGKIDQHSADFKEKSSNEELDAPQVSFKETSHEEDHEDTKLLSAIA